MGQSTDGQICYGVPFEEGYEFPWSDEYIDDWWIRETGWEKTWPYPAPFTDGDYSPGYSRNDPRIEEYFDSRRDWLKSHPLPVTEVNYCSSDVPMIMLACPSTVREASRGYPERFEPSDLVVLEEERKALNEFCTKYGLDPDEEEGWYLSSYWG